MYICVRAHLCMRTCVSVVCVCVCVCECNVCVCECSVCVCECSVCVCVVIKTDHGGGGDEREKRKKMKLHSSHKHCMPPFENVKFLSLHSSRLACFDCQALVNKSQPHLINRPNIHL